MDVGYLQTGIRIACTKKIHKVSLFSSKGVNFQAYICKKCKKVLLDYSDKNYEEG